MTNEEAIKEIKRRNCKGYKHEEMCQWAGEGFGSCEECCYGLAMKVLENNATWIPIIERLPKIAGVYRVTRYYPKNVMNPVYLVDACCFDGSNTWYNDNRINHERAYVNNVIAWQENPEPYKDRK